jgi:hypothetical protein
MRGDGSTRRARRVGSVAGVVALLAAATAVALAGSARPAGSAGAAPGGSGCGTTEVVHDDRQPAWTESAALPSGVPYVVSEDGDVVGVLFGAPLRAGKGVDRQNKILWVVRTPRRGRPLRISGHPRHRSAPSARLVQPADAEPGEIYPMYVDVPTAGCWHLTLRWAGNVDHVDLRYEAATGALRSG